MKIAVTGANGYIGSHIVKDLLKYGHEVIAIDLNNDKIDKSCTFIKTDILNTSHENLYETFKRPDALLHLAWKDGFNHFSYNHIDNLANHFYFIKSVIDSGCKSISVMGTVHEIGYFEGKIDEYTPCNPMSYYGIAKNTLRQLLQTYTQDKNIVLKWLRAFYIYGDDKNNHSIFTKIIDSVENGQKVFPFTNGLNQFDFIHVSDLSYQICRAITQNDINGIINICSGKATSIKDKVEEFIKTNHFDIKLDYGKFPNRRYDSPVIYGDNTKITTILNKY